jgi:hypothetical protein
MCHVSDVDDLLSKYPEELTEAEILAYLDLIEQRGAK